MKTQYTQYTPIPPQVPRQLAIELLQSHSEIITLNPLVLDYKPIKAPRDCPNDEYYSTWYEIDQRIQFVPGLKKIGSGKITFRGCFHDMPWGVQTHMYVPMGVDLRNKWQIKGSQPGEAPEPRELGSGAPSSGLYLREEVTIKCNPLALSFVKKEEKAAAHTMVERMIKKAELLDSGALQAMFENGKLKTFNPADRTTTIPQSAFPSSPGPQSLSFPDQHRPESMQSSVQRMSTHSQSSRNSGYQVHNRETPNSVGQIAHPDGQGFVVEMPGDFLYPGQSVDQNRMGGGSDRQSVVSGSDRSPDQRNSRWSFVSDDRNNIGTSRPASHATSPVTDPRSYTTELPGLGHKDAEINKPVVSQSMPGRQQQPPQPPQQQGVPQTYAHQAYNPQKYARFAGNGYPESSRP